MTGRSIFSLPTDAVLIHAPGEAVRISWSSSLGVEGQGCGERQPRIPWQVATRLYSPRQTANRKERERANPYSLLWVEAPPREVPGKPEHQHREGARRSKRRGVRRIAAKRREGEIDCPASGVRHQANHQSGTVITRFPCSLQGWQSFDSRWQRGDLTDSFSGLSATFPNAGRLAGSPPLPLNSSPPRAEGRKARHETCRMTPATVGIGEEYRPLSPCHLVIKHVRKPEAVAMHASRPRARRSRRSNMGRPGRRCGTPRARRTGRRRPASPPAAPRRRRGPRSRRPIAWDRRR